jgi:hypothetical protein
MSRMLDQLEWSNWICDELDQVLTLLRARYGLYVSEVRADLKSGIAEIYLNANIPAEAIETLKRDSSSNQKLRFSDNSIVCLEHYCSVEGSS